MGHKNSSPASATPPACRCVHPSVFPGYLRDIANGWIPPENPENFLESFEINGNFPVTTTFARGYGPLPDLFNLSQCVFIPSSIHPRCVFLPTDDAGESLNYRAGFWNSHQEGCAEIDDAIGAEDNRCQGYRVERYKHEL